MSTPDGTRSDRTHVRRIAMRRTECSATLCVRPRTVYVDWAEMEAHLSTRAAHSASFSPQALSRRIRPRRVTTVDAEVALLRSNVRDGARTVLTWMAALADANADGDIDRVLNQCLRPGPDVSKVNYAAMAREIRKTLGVMISAKRVRTAIEHLRRSCGQGAAQPRRRSIVHQLEALQSRLCVSHASLLQVESPDRRTLRRSIAIEVLAAVRCAAGRLIENGYGEHIPDRVDLESLEDRYLDFVRCVVNDRAGDRLDADFHQLLVTLCEHDRIAEHDMRLVVDGARVVAVLSGPDSLAGLLAQLNVLVAGRQLIDSELYCAEMMRLATAATGLHDDPRTRSFMNWVRRQPTDHRVPSALRVGSYCLNNAATHILERLFEGELPDDGQWLARAESCLDQMKSRDGGFRLIRTTEVLLHTVRARLNGQTDEVVAHFIGLGRDAALEVLCDLAEFDNCIELCRAAEAYAVRALPEIKHQLLRLG